jgi:tetratricopeptide (TPR) repeat protein
MKKSHSTPHGGNLRDAQVQAAFQQAIALHQQGLIEQAATIYEDILRLRPMHFDALHCLGVVASQRGEHQQAVECFSKAIKLHSKNPFFHFNLGVSLEELGQLEAALSSYEKTLKLDINHADAI